MTSDERWRSSAIRPGTNDPDSQARRPERPEAGQPACARRAHAQRVLPLHAFGCLRGPPQGARGARVARPRRGRGPAHALRASAGLGRGDRRTPLQEEGPGHLQLGRHQLERLRHRGDPAGAAARGRGHRGAEPGPAGGHQHRPAAGRGRHQLPPGGGGLPHRRRLLLGLQGQPRPAGLAGGGGGPAHRLRAHGGGVHLVRLRADRGRRAVAWARGRCSSRWSSWPSSPWPTCAACARPATSSPSPPISSWARRC